MDSVSCWDTRVFACPYTCQKGSITVSSAQAGEPSISPFGILTHLFFVFGIRELHFVFIEFIQAALCSSIETKSKHVAIDH